MLIGGGSSAGVSLPTSDALVGGGAPGTPSGVLAFKANSRKPAFFYLQALLQHWNASLSQCLIIFVLTGQFFPKRNNIFF